MADLWERHPTKSHLRKMYVSDPDYLNSVIQHNLVLDVSVVWLPTLLVKRPSPLLSKISS
jgi:hypothetical protein